MIDRDQNQEGSRQLNHLNICCVDCYQGYAEKNQKNAHDESIGNGEFNHRTCGDACGEEITTTHQECNPNACRRTHAHGYDIG